MLISACGAPLVGPDTAADSCTAPGGHATAPLRDAAGNRVGEAQVAFELQCPPDGAPVALHSSVSLVSGSVPVSVVLKVEGQEPLDIDGERRVEGGMLRIVARLGQDDADQPLDEVRAAVCAGKASVEIQGAGGETLSGDLEPATRC